MKEADAEHDAHGRPPREYELDGEVTVFDPETGQALFLNTTASQIWRRADGSSSEAQIVADLAHDYGVAPADIADDICSVLDQLAHAGLLERRDPPQRRQA